MLTEMKPTLIVNNRVLQSAEHGDERLRHAGELRPGDGRPQSRRLAAPLGGLLYDELERLGL